MARKKGSWDSGRYYCPCCQRWEYFSEWRKAEEARCKYCGTPIKGNRTERMNKIIKPRFVHDTEETFSDSFKVWMGWKIPKMRLEMQYGCDVTDEEKEEYKRIHGI